MEVVTLNYITPLIISVLDSNFNKSTIGLNSISILYMLAKFQDDQKSITMSSIICLNLKFLHLKLCVDQMVNDI